MSLTGLAFFAVYAALAVACLLFHPVFGVIGYYLTYIVSPATRWWGEPLAYVGFRFSYVIAAVTLAGLVIHFRSLKEAKGISFQEVLLWVFVGSIWVSGFLFPPMGDGDNHALKLTKAALMLFVLKRSVDTLPRFRWVIWALLAASVYDALDTRLLADRIGSRVQAGAGGSDFAEGNFLAAHLSVILPFLGVLILSSKWKFKVPLIAGAALVVDAIVQCRSRGAFLAILGGGAVALAFAPRGARKAVFVLALAGGIGGFALVDAGYLDRMLGINAQFDLENQDMSSVGRLLAWRAAIQMTEDHPLGVGYNNFKARIQDYVPSLAGRDTHSTYLRCLAELGVQGFLILSLLVVNALLQAYRLRRQVMKRPEAKEFALFVYASGVALVVYLIAGAFISLTYIEDFFLVLLLPDVLAALHAAEVRAREPVLPDLHEAGNLA